jgi:methylenetetrahydrofolate reductase (NADPH)
MSFPASATDLDLQARLSELLAAGSLEISPREIHRAKALAAVLPANTCVYIPSLPGLPLGRTLEAVAALRAVGLDPVPHVSARRILDREEFRGFLEKAVRQHGVHRVLLIGGDEPRPKGPYHDSLQIPRRACSRNAACARSASAATPKAIRASRLRRCTRR